MRKKITSIFAGIVAIIVFGGFYLLSAQIWASPPSTLKIVVDHTNKTIISPECLYSELDLSTTEFEIIPLNQARDLGYTYDSSCTDESLHPNRNIAWDFIGTKLGFLKPINGKWHDDGSWNEDYFK